MAQDFARALGQRLRAIRQQQGLSLQGVEEKSEGRWKAVVIGSYERGDRAVTVMRLAELAEFYSVPISELLPRGMAITELSGSTPGNIVLDLERLRELDDVETAMLARFVASIQAQRGDYNGRVLTIRRDDLRTLALMYDEPPARLAKRLESWSVLQSREA